ncbi:unnamed protein product [Sphagnum troendelagicum]|uniref:Uncharacterized protein n=1 Tax=Sphagnum troendelagicum TaxID=128251 RepID=A0ABP0TV98_9BRYO
MVASSIFDKLFPIHTTVMAWCTKKMSCGRMMEDATKKMQVSSVSNLLILSWSLTSSPLDYVTTVADIHEQQEFASQEEKAPLDLEQSFVFRRLVAGNWNVWTLPWYLALHPTCPLMLVPVTSQQWIQVPSFPVLHLLAAES